MNPFAESSIGEQPPTYEQLRSQLLARDLECVRLRAGLIRALAEIDALDNMREQDFGSWMPGPEIAELRKLVQRW